MGMRWMALALIGFMGCTASNPDAGGGGNGGGGNGGGGNGGCTAGDPACGGGGGGGGGGGTDGGGGGGTDGGGGGTAHDYGQDGPAGVTSMSFTVQNGSSSFTEVAWLPSTTGAHPVVILSSGLQQPAAAYAPYGKRLASWGVIVLERDDPGVFGQSSTLVDDVTYLVTNWLPAQNADASSALHGLVDATRVGLAGHSRGGQVSLLAAEGGLSGKIVGVFGLDPVDGSMSGATARGALPNLGVPTAFIGETTDSGGSGGSMACAPAADNYQVLYAAAPAPSVAITAVNADHTQFEDPASCSFCTFCTAGSADGKTVLAYSVKYLTTFFARELLGDSTVDPTLGSAADVAAGLVTVTNK